MPSQGFQNRALLILAGLGVSLLLLKPTARLFSSETIEQTKAQLPDLTDPVLCSALRGFRDFEVRDNAKYRSDEKLQIYFEPFNYLIVRAKKPGQYEAHLTEDVTLRRKGETRSISTVESIVEYHPILEHPPTPSYLATTITLTTLRPGEYEIDLKLRDELAEGRPTAKRTIAFEVIEVSETP